MSTSFRLLLDRSSGVRHRRRLVADLHVDRMLMRLATSAGIRRQQRSDDALASLTNCTKDLHSISQENWLNSTLLKLLHIQSFNLSIYSIIQSLLVIFFGFQLGPHHDLIVLHIGAVRCILSLRRGRISECICGCSIA